jgi:hypothetical protein
MAELKTKPNNASVEDFLNKITDEKKRKDAFAVLAIMKKATGAKPKMWGTGIVGFGDLVYRYESGRQLDWFLAGFSPRKQNLTLYLMPGIERYAVLLKKLGKHKTGKGCLYINSLEDVDKPTLEKLVKQSVKDAVKLFKEPR